MPELPEVESTVRRLRPDVVGQCVASVDVYWERSIACPALKVFRQKLKGKVVSSVSRRGKYIVISFEDAGALLIHLRMSGKIACFPPSTQNIKHTRVKIQFESGTILRFDDVRKFGKLFYVNDVNEFLSDLGVEPLGKSFTIEYFKEILQRKQAIKSFLLDQHNIAGIGNIYADESLWLAKIHPLRLASSLQQKEIENLHSAIQEILKDAIAARGTDFGDNVVVGDYSPQIYGRAGKKCLRCKSIIQHIKVGQRGTNFCPKCQKI